jgi:hypothetical protein
MPSLNFDTKSLSPEPPAHAFQGTSIWEFASFARGLEVFWCDSEVCCSGGGDAEGPCVFAVAFEGAVGPFVSVR